ncbi:DUF7507 domain-containing protein, partial [Agromyces aerolatus]|nr:hypothetical protein [Agromyces sp. LY-1074]MDR5705211.1 hypothetical protein [Agromyces sp. LY-1358]
DRDAGEVVNTATTTGTPPRGPDVTDVDDHEQPVPQAPGIQLVKTGSLTDRVISYEFTVTNTGDVTLTEVSISDELAGLSEIVFGEWPAEAGVLAPGESVTATATYRVTDADRATGSVTNSATATGLPPAGPAVTDGDDVTVSTPAPPAKPAAPLADTGFDGERLIGVGVLAALTLLAGAGALVLQRRARA